MATFDADQLPVAVAELLRLNNYSVEGPLHIHGAEIDLVATPLSDPFAEKLYIEVTLEYVSTDKYGKDLSKLAMIRALDPAARCLIVSDKGFTLNVKERAEQTRIMTLTYDELFAKFERFEPYVDRFMGAGVVAESLRQLNRVYQHPKFNDAHGDDEVLPWLNNWLANTDTQESWLIIVGEYGTGKTALTRVLQAEWLEAHKQNPALPIPLRIELGNFTRQFDAQGLLHHFLDNNGLSHVPVDFLWALIRSGRVILLLDGYDEMAQYLNQRERRECLKTLAELTGDGAMGILTSRPNYFSETEELTLLDHLYRNLELRSKYLTDEAESLRSEEDYVDRFIERNILQRYERSIQDLSPEQTELLVRGILSDQAGAADTVIAILNRVFRASQEGNDVALSGKPVIISYLVEVAANLVNVDVDVDKLSEWDVYTLVLDKLALRDLNQAGQVSVEERRRFLQALAVWLTRTGSHFCTETEFRELIKTHFAASLRRTHHGQRDSLVESYFEDLRRSGSLSRDPFADSGWKFSHNSLREFLVAEQMLEDLEKRRPLNTNVPISDAMRTFAMSRGETRVRAFTEILTERLALHDSSEQTGPYIALLYGGINAYLRSATEQDWHPLKAIAGPRPLLEDVQLAFMSLSSENTPAQISNITFTGAELSTVSFDHANLSGARFSGSLLDGVSFRSADLSHADFENAILADVSMSGTALRNADFRGVDENISLVIGDASNNARSERITGDRAIGYLRLNGALTKDVDPALVWCHHPLFAIVSKIAGKLIESPQRQRRGLVQRGVASQNMQFARMFVDFLESQGWVRTPGGRLDIVELTSPGRAALTSVASGDGLDNEIEEFLIRKLG